MTWWRVEVDETGRVVSCVEAEPCETASRTVFYVRANCEQSAQANAYQRYKEMQRNAKRERRIRHRQLGKCPDCGRPPKPGFKHCQVCIDGVAASKARAQQKAAGEVVAPLPPKSVALAVARETRDESLRLEVLQEVHRAWMHSKTEQEFTGWLLAQLRKLGGKAAA